MVPTRQEARTLFLQLGGLLRDCIFSSFPLNLWVSPPLVFLEDLNTLYKEHFSDLTPFLKLVAQDISAHHSGAYTGETAGFQAKEVGASAVLIGHAERRLFHHESLKILRNKCNQAIHAGLIPILCVGEDKAHYDQGVSIPTVLEELQGMLVVIKSSLQEKTSSESPLIIAYEPRWAIGTNRTPPPQTIQEMMYALGKTLRDELPSYEIPLLYGGSVDSHNGPSLLSIDLVSGWLIGGKSLSFLEMEKLINSIK